MTFKLIKQLIIIIGVTILALSTIPSHACADIAVFVNELHYDNDGTDTGEGIEIAGPFGTDLTGWTIDFYNGGNGTVYRSIDLSGTIPDQQNGYGAIFFSESGLQNGAPDGFALVNAASDVVQFLSYEGSFLAGGGSADGMMSVDVGVFEESSTPEGLSLQLIGSGLFYEDFTWSGPVSSSYGDINTGQTIAPIPGAAWLLISGLLGLGLWRRKPGN